MSTDWLAVRTFSTNTPLRSENLDRVSDLNFLVVGREVSECRPAFGLDFRFSGDSLRLHHGLDFVKVPRAKLVGINAHVKRERQRLVRQVAVRVSVEVPRALGVVWPHSHRIMAKHDSLLRCVDLGQQIP